MESRQRLSPGLEMEWGRINRSGLALALFQELTAERKTMQSDRLRKGPKGRLGGYLGERKVCKHLVGKAKIKIGDVNRVLPLPPASFPP